VNRERREKDRLEAQELAWQAMDALSGGDDEQAERLCRAALAIYPDCVDPLCMLAGMKRMRMYEYVEAMRMAVEAGRRDVGAKCLKEHRGMFWGILETRPLMRAMELLAGGLLEWGTPERVDEAITVMEEMLDLNPNDNQGIRDPLAGAYLARKRYADAARRFERYPADWLATPAWAKVLLAHATEGDERAKLLLAEARKRNRYVEAYLTGRKRRPRSEPSMYSPGDQDEAVVCVAALWSAWKAHPKSRKWLLSLEVEAL
jgi:tetratricopeptide (TPR) repeat protein